MRCGQALQAIAKTAKFRLWDYDEQVAGTLESKEDPHLIFQDHLDRCGDAMVAGDIDAVLQFFTMPNTVESYEGRRVLADEAQTRALFETVVARQRDMQMTHMIRRCLQAEFKDNDTIWATHETRYICRGNILTLDPHMGFSVVKRCPDGWKVSFAQFTVEGKNPLSRAMNDLKTRAEGG